MPAAIRAPASLGHVLRSYPDTGGCHLSAEGLSEIALQRAREFPVKQKAVFENYLMDEGLADGFEKLDLLSIPADLIYGRDGSLRHKLTGDDPNNQFTSADIEAAIEQLLHNQG